MSFKSHFVSVSLVAVLAFLPTTVNAQSSEFYAQNHNQSEARIGISIPFGTHRRDAVSKPKLTFTVRHYNQANTKDLDWMLRSDRDALGRRYNERDISLTLTKSPELFLDGHRIKYDETMVQVSDEVKTAGKVGLVALGVAVVAGGAFIIYASASGGFSGGPDD